MSIKSTWLTSSFPLWALTLLLASVSLYAENTINAKEVHVSQWGATPDDGIDDTSALRKAVEYCRNHPGTTLIIPSGVYELKDEQAQELEKKAYAGELGRNVQEKIFLPYYPYAKGLDFEGAKNTTIKADGVTLHCSGWMEPISLINTENIHIQGLTIDYPEKPFSHGKVVEITNDYFDVQFSKERVITEKTPLMRMTFWDHRRNRVDPHCFYHPQGEILNDNKVRFKIGIPKELLGSTTNVNHCFHFRPAILILNSKNTTLEQITIHSQPGMGIVGFDSKDILIKELAIKPSPGYTQSTNTDATHFAACEGLLRFESCYFEGQGDDATNVHGYYQTINKAEGKSAELQIKADTYTHAQVNDVPRVGDIMELVNIRTLEPEKELKVEKVTFVDKTITCQVELSEELPKNYQDYYLMNVTKLPKLEFENSIINSHLARGILIKTRDVKISNNVFRYCTGTAIHVGAEANWHEGTHAKNVLIENNMITGCGSGSGGQGGASGIAVIIEAKDTSKSILHDNITIRNNMIIGENHPCGIYIGNAKNVHLEANHVIQCENKIKTHSTQNISIKD